MHGHALGSEPQAGMSFRKPLKAKSHLRRRKRRDNESDDEDADDNGGAEAGTSTGSGTSSSASAVAQKLQEVRDEQRIRRE